MLNVNLEKSISIGTIDSFLYTLSCLQHGTDSLCSLQQLLFNRFGIKRIDVANSIYLLEAMELLSLDGDDIRITDRFVNSYKPSYEYHKIFSQQIIDYLIAEDVLHLDKIRYNLVGDYYYLPNSSFKMKHAIYRNILLMFGCIKLEDNSTNYVIVDLLLSKLENESSVKKLSLTNLKRLLEKESEMGECGEQFVISYEQKRLSAKKNIKQISIMDVAAGFDIASYNSVNDVEYTRFIEVKTYRGEVHFYWSSNEIEKASRLREHYYLYLVDFDSIQSPGYQPEIICDPYTTVYVSDSWHKKADSLFITKKY